MTGSGGAAGGGGTSPPPSHLRRRARSVRSPHGRSADRGRASPPAATSSSSRASPRSSRSATRGPSRCRRPAEWTPATWSSTPTPAAAGVRVVPRGRQRRRPHLELHLPGPRRTQSLHAAPLRGTEPFHWDGEESDITRLMSDVFVGRMSGPVLGSDQINGLMNWIDGQPRRPRALPGDTAAVAHGRTLFNDPAAPTAPAATRAPCSRTTRRWTSAPAARSRCRRCSASARAGRSCTTAARRRSPIASPTECGGGTATATSAISRAASSSDLVAFLQSI